MGDSQIIKHGIITLLGYVLRHRPGAMRNLTSGLEALGETGGSEGVFTQGSAEINRDAVTLARLFKRAREGVFEDPGIAALIGRKTWNHNPFIQLGVPGAKPAASKGFRFLPEMIQELLGPLAGSEVYDFGQEGCGLTMRWLAPVGADICQFIQGAISSLPGNWQGPDIAVKELACQFDGADACRFILSWPRPSWRSRLMLRVTPPRKPLPQEPSAPPVKEEAEPDKAPLEQSGLDYIRRFLDEAAEAVYLLNFEGRVTYANVMAMGMFGQFAKLENIDEVLPEGLVDWDSELRPLIQKGDRLLKEAEFTAINGETLLLECKAHILGPNLIHLCLRDVSLAAKVKTLSQTLEQTGNLTLTLNQPLMSLMSSAELLTLRSEPETMARMSAIIVSETKRLAEMVQQLGDFYTSANPGAVKRIR